MKIKKALILLLICTICYGQFIELPSVKISKEKKIEYQILKIQKQLNKFTKESKRATYIRIKNYEINVNKNQALVLCDIYLDNFQDNKVLVKQILKFSKKQNWELSEYPYIFKENI